MSNQTIQISQLHATPADTYVNGIVEGYLVGYVAGRTEKQPARATLQEGAGQIALTLWGGNLGHWEGKRVRLSGKGMKVTEFKGTKQLSVGDKVTIEGAVGASTTATIGNDTAANPARFTGRTDAPVGGGATGRLAPQEILPVNLPRGDTVGMVMKLAAEIMLAQSEGGAIFRQPGWDVTMFKISHTLLNVSTALCNGDPLHSDPPVQDDPNGPPF